MPKFVWRERLKSGPLRGVYGAARRIKRAIKREPVAGVVAMPVTPYSLDQLIALEPDLGHTGRFRYSMAWCHLDAGRNLLAIAWGTTAMTAQFEASERAALLVAIAAHRNGEKVIVARLLPYLRPDEMTAHELTLFAEIKSLWKKQNSGPPKEWTYKESMTFSNDTAQLAKFEELGGVDTIRLFNRTLNQLQSEGDVKSAEPEEAA